MSVLWYRFFIFQGRETVMAIRLDVPVLTTERLIIRPIELTDTDDLFEICADPRVNDWLSYPLYHEKEKVREYIEMILNDPVLKHIPPHYVLVEKKSGKMIGTCDFVKSVDGVSEIGYSLNYNYWGQGYMSEALPAVIQTGFEHIGFRRIEIRALEANQRSIRVIEKAGFVYEGTQRKAAYDKISRDYMDVRCYSLLKEDWEEQK